MMRGKRSSDRQDKSVGLQEIWAGCEECRHESATEDKGEGGKLYVVTKKTARFEVADRLEAGSGK